MIRNDHKYGEEHNSSAYSDAEKELLPSGHKNIIKNGEIMLVQRINKTIDEVERDEDPAYSKARKRLTSPGRPDTKDTMQE